MFKAEGNDTCILEFHVSFRGGEVFLTMSTSSIHLALVNHINSSKNDYQLQSEKLPFFKMYFLLNMDIFQPAILGCQKLCIFFPGPT